MNGSIQSTYIALLAIIALLLLPTVAYGYGGPGSVISGVGAMLAVIVAIGASIFGFVWFPLKRLARKLAVLRGGAEPDETAVDSGELTS